MPENEPLTIGGITMAREQVAKCVDVISYEDRKTGKTKEFYKFVFEASPDTEFSVYPSKYFEAAEGDRYTPVVVVYPKPYTDKEGKLRVQNALTVNWEAK
jgi:hypothetical protein